MRARTTTALLLLAAAVGLAVGTPAASAQTASTTGAGGRVIAALQQRGDNEINNRLTDLDRLTERINGDDRITATQKTTLLSLISSDRTGLTDLKTKIDGDTDLATLRTDLQSIVLKFRIYVLLDPEVHLLVAADEVLDVTTVLTNLETKLAPRLNGLNNPTVTAALKDAQEQTTAAAGLVQPVPAELAALTPAGYPANKATLQSARAALATARSDLGKARGDIQTIISALHAGSAATTSTTA